MSEDFKAYNIYDLAGNMWEWTTETGKNNNANNGDPTCNENKCPEGSATNAVIRGGSFYDNGSSHSVVFTDGNCTVAGCGVNFGFRVVLYFWFTIFIYYL